MKHPRTLLSALAALLPPPDFLRRQTQMSLAPAAGTARILSLGKSAGNVVNLRLLGSDQRLKWSQTAQALETDFRGIETRVDGFAVEVTLESQTGKRIDGE